MFARVLSILCGVLGLFMLLFVLLLLVTFIASLYVAPTIHGKVGENLYEYTAQ